VLLYAGVSLINVVDCMGDLHPRCGRCAGATFVTSSVKRMKSEDHPELAPCCCGSSGPQVDEVVIKSIAT